MGWVVLASRRGLYCFLLSLTLLRETKGIQCTIQSNEDCVHPAGLPQRASSGPHWPHPHCAQHIPANKEAVSVLALWGLVTRTVNFLFARSST